MVNVLGEILPKRFNKRLIILCCVQFFRTKKLQVAVFPGSCEHVNVEQCFEISGYVLEEREYTSCRMLITERVKDEPFFRDKRVAVRGNPILSRRRRDAPR